MARRVAGQGVRQRPEPASLLHATSSESGRALPQWTVFGGCTFLYFLLISGSIYNISEGVPAIGEVPDSRGVPRPSMFLVGHLNEQV